jgi:hypothetical protein
MPKPERGRLMSRMYQFIANRDDLTLFAIRMQKACEEMAGHFDRYLENFEIDKPQHGRQRGLMIFDQSKHEKTVQALLAQYRTTGASFGGSSASQKYRCFLTRRLRACCNSVAYAVFKNYERADGQFLNTILKRVLPKRHLIRHYQPPRLDWPGGRRLRHG